MQTRKKPERSPSAMPHFVARSKPVIELPPPAQATQAPGNPDTTLIKALAQHFVAHAAAAGLRGAARDKAAEEWFLGAADALAHVGMPAASRRLHHVAIYIVGARGYAGVEECVL